MIRYRSSYLSELFFEELILRLDVIYIYAKLDHLPISMNPIWIAQIPYLSRQEYDCLEFSSHATYSHFANSNKSAWLPYTSDITHQTVTRGFSPLLLEKLKDTGY